MPSRSSVRATAVLRADSDRPSARTRSGRPSARWTVAGSEDERTKSFGATLFEALINGKVKRVFDSSDGNAESTGVRLILDDPEAAWIPWELMLDPTTGVPFAARHRLVRGFSTPTEARSLEILRPPLGILLAESSPIGTVALESQLEVEDIERALTPLIRRRVVAVRVLRNVTEPSLQDALREGIPRGRGQQAPTPIHIVHWIGHGGIDRSTASAAILFERDDGRPDVVDGQRLATLLSGSDIRLIFLNACYSAATPGADGGLTNSTFQMTTGIAEAILASGVPGIIGMQAAILDDRARLFSRDFYEALADGRGIDMAVQDARRLVKGGSVGAAGDVSIPVCYLRAGPTQMLEARPRGRLARLAERFSLLSRGIQWTIKGIAGVLLGLAVSAVVNGIAGIIEGPPKMTGEFNVVVSEFVASGLDGQPLESETAKALSTNLYESLLGGLEELEFEPAARHHVARRGWSTDRIDARGTVAAGRRACGGNERRHGDLRPAQ